MFFPLYNGLKKRREPCVLGLSPLCYYKDTTFSAEIQIALTYRNSLRNVKRRVLHTRAPAMYYITTAFPKWWNSRTQLSFLKQDT